jgi:hypothetical protein
MGDNNYILPGRWFVENVPDFNHQTIMRPPGIAELEQQIEKLKLENNMLRSSKIRVDVNEQERIVLSFMVDYSTMSGYADAHDKKQFFKFMFDNFCHNIWVQFQAKNWGH